MLPNPLGLGLNASGHHAIALATRPGMRPIG